MSDRVVICHSNVGLLFGGILCLSIVLFLMVISLDIKEYNVIISNTNVDMVIICKLSFNCI